MNLELLFPTPVAFFELGFELNKKERSFLDKQERRPNDGNQSSVNSYLLKEKQLSRISERIDECVMEYAKDVWKCKSDPWVTQSWLNWTGPSKYHHKHNHSNSMYSGVLYVDVDDERDRITFFQDGYRQIKPEFETPNIFNADFWWLPVKTGQIIIFPSNLTHMVESVQTGKFNKERLSLAFNTFASKIGSHKDLTELIV